MYFAMIVVLSRLLIFRKAKVKSGRREGLRNSRVQRASEMRRGVQMAKRKLNYSLAWWNGMKVRGVSNENTKNACVKSEER